MEDTIVLSDLSEDQLYQIVTDLLVQPGKLSANDEAELRAVDEELARREIKQSVQ